MPGISLTTSLIKEYETMFNSCVIKPEQVRNVERIVSTLLSYKARYQSVSTLMGAPWFFIGAIHNMESNLNFNCHLHNGDPLAAHTVHVPAGRPKNGTPPFTWEESARDALAMRGLSADTEWSLAGILYQLEAYNGWGYRMKRPEAFTPYLWSYSNHYTTGKFVADDRWSETAVSKQCGAAVILRRLAELSEISFSDQPLLPNSVKPLIIHFADAKSHDSAEVAKTIALQQWLNTFAGIFVKVDGIPGARTSDAYQKVVGTYLPGDPRATA